MLKETFIELLKSHKVSESLIVELWAEIEKSYSNKNRYYHTLHHLNSLLCQLKGVQPQIENWDTILFTPIEIIERCKKQILATKRHVESKETDTNYFTDADLSILGQEWETYSTYFKNVRKEYSIYPNLVYNPGRKKVLNHFLSMNRIFKTDYFYNKFEEHAKQNLRRELDVLQ